MAKAISWRLEDEKIILSVIVDEAGLGQDVQEIDVEIPMDIFKEMLVEGPPTEEKQIRELIDKIIDIKTKRVLTIEQIDKDLGEIINKEQSVYGDLQNAQTRTEIQQYGAMIRSLTGQKAALDTRRHLVRLLYQEEGSLRGKLARKLRGA